MLDTWLSLKADEIQKYADRKDLDGLYEAFGTLHGPQPHGTSVYWAREKKKQTNI